MGWHSLFQGIFSTQRSNACLLRVLHWQADSLPLHYLGSLNSVVRVVKKRAISILSFIFCSAILLFIFQKQVWDLHDINESMNMCCSCAVPKSCPIFHNPMDYSTPSFTVLSPCTGSWPLNQWCFQCFIDAFEMWCWRRLLRVPWTARRSRQSTLKEIKPEYSLEGLMLKLWYFDHLMWRANSLEKTQTLGKIEGRKRKGQRVWDVG